MGKIKNIFRYDLADFEQYVNDRRLSSPAPDISSNLLPEFSKQQPMLWAVLPSKDVRIYSDQSSGKLYKYSDGLKDDEKKVVYFPIHPLEIDAYKKYPVIESGVAKISASYRTFFFEPDPKGVVKLIPPQGYRFMLKLHLEQPLPGIAGDRRLTKDIVEKCIAVSRELTELKKKGELSSYLNIIREEVGLLFKNQGVLIRKIPVDQFLIPAFSLSSPDQLCLKREALAITILKKAHVSTGIEPSMLFGKVFAKPLIASLLSGFKQGFSLEMHMQNVLFGLNNSGMIDSVLYRDLEGVIFSKKFRKKKNLSEIFKGDNNPQLHLHGNIIARFFNRNYDYDVGRIFDNILFALKQYGYFNAKDVQQATKSVQQIFKKEVEKAGIKRWNYLAYLFKLSRTPYGNGTRPCHYYKCSFR